MSYHQSGTTLLENLPLYKRYQLVIYTKIVNNGKVQDIGLKQEMFNSKEKLIHFIKTNTVYYQRMKIVVFPYVDDDDNELIVFEGFNPYFNISMLPKPLAKQIVMT